MPIVARGITYRGTNLVQIVGGQVRIVLRLVNGLDSGPRTRGLDTVIPAAAGRIPRNRVADGRIISAEGWVCGCGSGPEEQAADYEAIMAELRALFDPTLAPGTLVVALVDGTTASIEATTLPEEPEWGPDNLPTYRALGVDFEAVDGADWQFETS